MNDLYNRLKELCDEKGISLAKMCLDCGMSKSTTTELKMGRTKSVSTATAQKIASYFGVSIGYLLGEDEETEKSSAEASDEDLKVALFGGDTDVSDEMWDEVMNYAEYLKQKYSKN